MGDEIRDFAELAEYLNQMNAHVDLAATRGARGGSLGLTLLCPLF